MELIDYLRIVRRRWFVIVVLAVLGGALGLAYAASKPAHYQSTTLLYVAPSQVGQNAVAGASTSEGGASSVAGFVQSHSLAAEVIKTTGVSLSVSQVLVEVQASTNGSNVSITVTDTDAHRAQTLATAYATGVEALAHQLAGTTNVAQSPLNLTIYDPATYPNGPLAQRSRLVTTGIAVVLGLLVGFGLAVLWDVTSRQRKA